MKRRILVTALAVVAAACGSAVNGAVDTTGPATTTTPTTATATTTTTPPGDPDRLLLQITDEGGLAPIELLVNRLPPYSVYADGTLLAPAPVPAIYPGPILTPVQSVALTGPNLDEISRLIDAIGLPGIDREIDNRLNSRVADATTTIATYFDADGGGHVYGAYALFLIEDEPTPDATRNLGLLVERLDALLAEGRAGDVFVPDRLQLWLDETPAVDPDFSQVRPWPLVVSPDDFKPEGNFRLRCHVLAGLAAEDARSAFAGANQATRWDYHGMELRILARPLLLGEPGCVP